MSRQARADEHAKLVQSWDRAALADAAQGDAQGDIRFSARSSRGELALALPRTASRGHEGALGAALALDQAEPLIQLLETWLQSPLDFAPSHAAVSASIVGADFQIPDPDVQSSSEAHATGTLWLPVQLARQLNAPTVALAEHLNWHRLQCNVQIGDQQLRSEQIAGLEIGGAILLPASFGSHWMAQLQSLAIPALTRSVHIDLAGSSIVLSCDALETRSNDNRPPDLPRMKPADRQSLAVSLTAALPVRSDVLLGWSDDVTVLPLDASLALQARAETGGQTLATGEIIPAGLGYACWITGLAGLARQASPQSAAATATV